MTSRRHFYKINDEANSLSSSDSNTDLTASPAAVVNDIHSQLNATAVQQIVKPESMDSAVKAIRSALKENRAVCIIFNLHVQHTAEGVRRSADTFRKLIDLGLRYGGSYYLTYHK